MSYKNLLRLNNSSIRKYGTKPKISVTANDDVINDIKSNIYKFRNHPGVFKPRTVILPDSFIKAVLNIVEDKPVSALLDDSKVLARHLKSRVPPMEQEELKETKNKIHEKVLSKFKNVVVNSEQEERNFKNLVQQKINLLLKEKIYNWKPLRYNIHNSLVYLFARSAAEYAVLVKIFGEIAKRDSEFKPKSFFDFGSGVGTATWAANMYWKKSIFEYFNVDSSSEMNDLAQSLLQGGRGQSQMPIKGVFYRQFLPATNTTYDITISAFSLLELPSLETRLEVMLNLWNKTQKYMVIVEQGTNAGFKVVNEVRDFILQIDSKGNKGHIFSPCPHDELCPRYVLDDGTPCNFEMTYFTLPIGANSGPKKELYTYVVLKKGTRKETDLQWPRIVRPVLVKSRHSICRLCTSNGKLDEVIFTTSKHGKTLYYCARSSKWGDALPITLNQSELSTETDCDENNKN